jgi:translation initiation factor 2 beta subunit (eIF-2beta)/eIF-5
MPALKLHAGKNSQTIITNMTEVCAALDREPKQLIAFLTKKMSISPARKVENGYSFSGKYESTVLQNYIYEFITTFVLCDECSNPETTLEYSTAAYKICTACSCKSEIKNATGQYIKSQIQNSEKQFREQRKKTKREKKTTKTNNNNKSSTNGTEGTKSIGVWVDADVDAHVAEAGGNVEDDDDDDWSLPTDPISIQQRQIECGLESLTAVLQKERRRRRQELKRESVNKFYLALRDFIVKHPNNDNDIEATEALIKLAMELQIAKEAGLIFVEVCLNPEDWETSMVQYQRLGASLCSIHPRGRDHYVKGLKKMTTLHQLPLLILEDMLAKSLELKIIE